MAKIMKLCIIAVALFGFCQSAAVAASNSSVFTIYTKVQEVTLLEYSVHTVLFYARLAVVTKQWKRILTETVESLCKDPNNTQWAIPKAGTGPFNGTAVVKSTHGGIVKISPENVDLSSTPPWRVNLTGTHRGHDTVFMDYNNSLVSVDNAFVVVTVAGNLDLVVVSTVVGWIYFVAWSISFYPQLYVNWKRKSVVGLNFDFLALNIIGFFMYSLFNCGLYWSKEIEDEYFAAHPRGLNPVLLNDVVFGLHACAITLVTIGQCFIYERGGQTISKIAMGIITTIFVIFFICLILPFVKVYNWLTFLYICSYIKLAITLMKYVPQAIMNYKRKSTTGWSIGNVILDFTGGMLSMMQMIINADNYDDWESIFGDPTKFGLGLFSVLFDILFLIQHYVLYRDQGYAELPGDVYQQSQTDSEEEVSEGTNIYQGEDDGRKMPDLVQPSSAAPSGDVEAT